MGMKMKKYLLISAIFFSSTLFSGQSLAKSGSFGIGIHGGYAIKTFTGYEKSPIAGAVRLSYYIKPEFFGGLSGNYLKVKSQGGGAVKVTITGGRLYFGYAVGGFKHKLTPYLAVHGSYNKLSSAGNSESKFGFGGFAGLDLALAGGWHLQFDGDFNYFKLPNTWSPRTIAPITLHFGVAYIF